MSVTVLRSSSMGGARNHGDLTRPNCMEPPMSLVQG